MPRPINAEIEAALISAFVVSRKRERYISLLRSPKRRQDFLRQLYHVNDFDPACVIPLEKGTESAAGLLMELSRRGAGEECYVISADADLDTTTGELASVITRVYASSEGTLVSCVPGRLAYYEGEPPKNRFILSRK